jgi:ADP-ribose pyrophosphatase YjhB (NUDIX family)
MDKWYNLCMLQKHNESLVLLTYKEKILLMIKNYVFNSGEQKTWCMVGGEKSNNESFENTILRKIKEEMKIEIGSVKFLSIISSDNKNTYFYHGKLTDNNVNLIERSDGQELQFFDLKELNKIRLTLSAETFFSQNKNTIEELLTN